MQQSRLLHRAGSASWLCRGCSWRGATGGDRINTRHVFKAHVLLPQPASTGRSFRGFFANATSSLKQQESEASSDQPQPPHVSVLLAETMEAFGDMKISTYVDGTLGAAGHASKVMQQHPELATLVGFDLDMSAHKIAGEVLGNLGAHLIPLKPKRNSTGKVLAIQQPETGWEPGITPQPIAYIVHSNFGSMKTVLSHLSAPAHPSGKCSSDGGLVGTVDAILLDLGMSSMQVDESERGFSFLRDGPLDMRMDPSGGVSAEDLVNGASEVELGRIFKEYGEERYWRSIARRVVSYREEQHIGTTQQLVKAIGNPGGGGRGRRDAKQKHPATRVFQALRIAVNGELQSIAQVLPDAIDCLRPGGRLAVITFHSLEDRIVKWAFRQAAGMAPSDESLPSYCVPFTHPLPHPLVRILTRRPLVPSQQEQDANSRSRSAKLRVVEKL